MIDLLQWIIFGMVAGLLTGITAGLILNAIYMAD